MTTVINIHASDDTRVGTIKFEKPIAESPWNQVLSNPFYAVDVTDLKVLPSPDDEWTGSGFATLSGHPNTFDDNVCVFAFVVNNRVAVIHPLDIDGCAGIIAAYMTGPRFELISDE
jgi:hypothetical protein